MCEYLKIIESKSSYSSELEALIRNAEESFYRENECVALIQKVFRGYCVRYDIYLRHLAANEIQRIFRSHIGKLLARHQARLKDKSREDALFTYFAVQVQRSFRGYYSRKYYFDFAKRKREIAHVIKRGNEIREELAEYAERQQQRLTEEERDKRNKQLKDCATNLHHLLSTKHIRGIYNPHPAFVEIPTLEATPAEEQIKQLNSELLRTRGIEKKGLITDFNGTKRVPLKGLQNHLSLQASSPYDAVLREQQRERALERILTRQRGNFFAGGKTDVINNYAAPLAVGDEYIDSWSNPMTIRGIPTSQQQLRESVRLKKPLFSRTSHALPPFVSRTGGNKSTVLANDLFDVIADAQQFGGSAQRHLSATQHTLRFGVPDNVDKRSSLQFEPNPPKNFIPKKSFKEFRSRTNMSKSHLRMPAHLEKEFDFNNSSDDEELSLPRVTNRKLMT